MVELLQQAEQCLAEVRQRVLQGEVLSAEEVRLLVALEKQLTDIRDQYIRKADDITGKDLADMFGLTPSRISQIRHSYAYKRSVK